MSATEQAREAVLACGGINWREDTNAALDRYAAAIRAERDAELVAMVEQMEPTMLAHADYISRKALLTALRTPTTEATNG